MIRLGSLALVGVIIGGWQSGEPAGPRALALERRQWPHDGRPTLDLSDDGRFLALESWARLSPLDSNVVPDVYVLDQLTGALTLESVNGSGAAANGASQWPRLSGDGRFVTFATVATDFDSVERQVHGGQVLLRDRREGRNILVSGAAGGGLGNGGSFNPAISGDGDMVAFESAATNLVAAHDANGARRDVFVFDVATGVSSLASLDSRGVQPAGGHSIQPALSSNGRFVAFASTASLVPDVPAGPGARPIAQVFVRDLVRGLTYLVSRAQGGNPGSGDSLAPALSEDGRFVAFMSRAADLVPRDRNGAPDVFVHDCRTGTTRLASARAGGGSASGRSMHPAISADGRFVAFASDAPDLLCAGRHCPPGSEDLNLVTDIYVHDLITGVTLRASGAQTGADPWWQPSEGVSMDAAGRHVAFSSRHPRDAFDRAFDFDAFLQELRWLPPSSGMTAIRPN